jgi:hypothetical protein
MSPLLILCIVAVVGLLCLRLAMITVRNLLSCWRNTTLSRQGKIFWLGIIILAWPFGSFFYEVVVERQPIVRFSTIFVAFSLTFCGTLLFLRPDVREKAWEMWQNPDSFYKVLDRYQQKQSPEPITPTHDG